jgi:hypothetical protein
MALGVDPTSIQDWEAGRSIRFYRCRPILTELLDELGIQLDDTAGLLREASRSGRRSALQLSDSEVGEGPSRTTELVR